MIACSLGLLEGGGTMPHKALHCHHCFIFSNESDANNQHSLLVQPSQPKPAVSECGPLGRGIVPSVVCIDAYLDRILLPLSALLSDQCVVPISMLG